MEAVKKPLRFTEPGSGLVMEFGKWYVLSDSGSSYTTQGFDNPQAASHWWEIEGRAQYEMPNGLHVPLLVPNFANGAWDDSDSPQCMKADDLYIFWDSDRDVGGELYEEYE